jgi:hypothetical protein
LDPAPVTESDVVGRAVCSPIPRSMALLVAGAFFMEILDATPLAAHHGPATAYGLTFLVLGASIVITIVETLRLPCDAGAAVTAA